MATPRRRPTRATVALVALSAGVLVLFTVLVPIHATLYGTVLPLAFLLGAAVCVAPVIAIRYPRWAIALFCAGALALVLVAAPEAVNTVPWPWSVPALLAFVVFIAVVTFLHGARMGLFPLGIGLAGSLVTPLLRPEVASASNATADLIVTASIAAGVYLITVLFAGRLRVGEELTRERELSAAEQSRRILVEERTRIARELHDVVAHTMSVIQVQASTAKYRVPELPEDAAREFDDIAAHARGALTEMRRLLGVLRTEDQGVDLAPQQGIADIPALVDSMRRAGARLDLEIDAAERYEIPAAVQIAAFRIVQEAISNAVRHAPGAAIAVAVHADDTAVRLRVRNDAAGDTTPHGAGHGLRGMQERATLLDGTLDAGPDPSGGWIVSAVLPWSTPSPDSEDAA